MPTASSRPAFFFAGASHFGCAPQGDPRKPDADGTGSIQI